LFGKEFVRIRVLLAERAETMDLFAIKSDFAGFAETWKAQLR